jgi:hypothetical protein
MRLRNPRMNFDPDVFYNFPGTGAAAYRSALTDEQATELDNFNKLAKLHVRLRDMDNSTAYKQFQLLDPWVQERMKETFPDIGESPYMEKPKNPLVAFGEWYVKDLQSPLIYAMGKLSDYNKALNTPYRALRAAGADPFSSFTGSGPLGMASNAARFVTDPEFRSKITDKKVWLDAWNGEAIFDEKAKAELDEVYTRGQRDLVVGFLEGKNVGEIIAERGGVDVELAEAFSMYSNNPDDFAVIVEDYRRAQVSPGRDITRQFGTEFTKPGRSEQDPWFTAVSGTIDAAYQVIIDPLTYVSFGTGNMLTKSGRLYQEILKKGTPGVEKYFEVGSARRFWDKGGKLVEDYRQALATPGAAGIAKAALVREDIRRGFFKLYSDENTLRNFVDAGIKDADTARAYFMNAENIPRLINGRVDGVTGYRETAPLAGITSSLVSGARTGISRIFNGQVNLDDVGKVDDLVKEINRLGKESVTANPSFPVIEEIINGNARLRRKIATLTANHPAPIPVFFGNKLAGQMGTSPVLETSKQINAFFRVLLDDANFSAILTENFLRGTPGERILFMEGAYKAMMYKMGLHTTPDGRKLMEQLLEGFSETSGSLNKFQAIQIFQESQVISPFPFVRVAEEINKNIRFSQKPLTKIFGGVVDSAFARKVTDGWVLFTLVPALGIRSAIDEGFFGSLTTPYDVISIMASGRANTVEKILSGIAQSDSGYGVVKSKILNSVSRSPAQRVQAIQKVVNEDEVFGEIVKSFQGRGKLTPEDITFLKEIIKDNPFLRTGLAESLIARINLTANMDRLVPNPVILPDEFARSIKDAGMIKGEFAGIPFDQFMTDFNLSQRGFVQLDNMLARFANKANSRTITIDKVSHKIDPASVFLKRNALRNSSDRIAAEGDILRSIGLQVNDQGSWYIKNEKLLDEFLDTNVSTFTKGSEGIPRIEIARQRVDDILDDLYLHFHGGRGQYNEGLYNYIVNTAKDKNKGFYRVLQDMEPGEYLSLLDDGKFGYNVQMLEEIRTAVYPKNFDPSPEGWFSRFRNWSFGAMDRQLTDLWRSPAVMAWSLKYNKDFDVFKNQYVEQLIEQGIKPSSAKAAADNYFSRLAVMNAADRVLKYVDNPLVRSNLSFNMRTVGRFYRATEDFLRRMYRMGTDSTARSLFRMRLLGIGLENAGFIHKDQDERSYVILPMDNIIHNAVTAPMRIFLKEDNPIVLPQFNEMTLTLRMLNPSLQEDAGLPVLSGPIAALTVRSVKNAIGIVGGENGKFLGLHLDTFLLGEMAGSNRPLFPNPKTGDLGIIAPGNFQKIFRAVPPWWMGEDEDRNVRDSNLVMSAMCYMQANELIPEKYREEILSDRITYRERDDFLKSLRMQIHGISVAKVLTGMFGFNVGMQDSIDLPSYVKDFGTITLRQEFHDIVDGISKLPPSQRPDDPYQTAIAMWVAQNPNKLCYTVSRNEKSDVFIRNTKEAVQWLVKNDKFVEMYKNPSEKFSGGAAYIFAPHSGDFDATSMLWMRGQGIIENRDLEEYYDDIMAVQLRQSIFDDYQRTVNSVSQTADPGERSKLLSGHTEYKKSVFSAYPRVEQMMNQDFSKSKEYLMFMQLVDMVNDPQWSTGPDAPIKPAVRGKINTTNNLVAAFIDFSKSDPGERSPEYMNIKSATKKRIEDLMKDYSVGDSNYESAVRSVYQPILNNLSRDVVLTKPRR